jgi:hypothetical protein
MWRVRENLIIKVYCHEGPPPVIALVVHNDTTKEVSGRATVLTTMPACHWHNRLRGASQCAPFLKEYDPIHPVPHTNTHTHQWQRATD